MTLGIQREQLDDCVRTFDDASEIELYTPVQQGRPIGDRLARHLLPVSHELPQPAQAITRAVDARCADHAPLRGNCQQITLCLADFLPAYPHGGFSARISGERCRKRRQVSL